MDRSMVKGIVIGGVAMIVVAAGAVPTYKALTKPKVADVIAVKEVTETVVTPREECQDVQVTKQAPTQDPNRVAGTVVGGVAGGLLGSTIGGGTGRTVATIAGAAGGAYVGNQVQKNSQQKNVVTSTQRRCKTVNDTTQNLVGYDVTYRLGDKESTVRTSYKPGATLPVKDGEVVTTPPAAG
ncbi:MAG: glycine zipper 2TM domain-containing protein [Terriglobia bacterium]